jgi:hypothetical protein
MAFVARSRGDFLIAVQLFTHCWGGILNAILPTPNDDVTVAAFSRALDRFDPDIIVFPIGDVTTYEQKAIGNRAVIRVMVTAERVKAHSEGVRLLTTSNGDIPHVGSVMHDLNPEARSSSIIRTMNDPSSDSTLAAVFGLPSDGHLKYLRTRLASQVYRVPKNLVDWTRLSAVTTRIETALSVTALQIRQQPKFRLAAGEELTVLEQMRIQNETTLFLFLDTHDTMSTLIAYWNAVATTSRRNKLLLPWSVFSDDPKTALEILTSAADPSELIIVAKCGQNEASQLHEIVTASLQSLNQNFPHSVLYNGFEYSLPRTNSTYGISRSLRVRTDSENRAWFSVETPPGHHHSRIVFGFDCEVKTDDGTSLKLPNLDSCARLLTNPAIRIQHARDNFEGLGQGWLNRNRFSRPSYRGVAGLLHPGEEGEFFLHEDDLWIREALADRGVELISGRPSRYALGFIRRFGGLEKALTLIMQGGQDILAALIHHRAEQHGLVSRQIVAFLENQAGYKQAEAKDLVDRRLGELIASGLISRGAGLTCPECDFGFWVSIDDLREFVACPGCAARFQISGNGLPYRFMANQLAERLLLSGGVAVLQTANVVRRIDASAAVEFGGELRHKGQTQSFGEIDFAAMTSGGLLLAECKAMLSAGPTEIDDLRSSGKKLVQIASDLQIADVILGVVARDKLDDLRQAIREVVQEGKSLGVVVDLVLNGVMYLRAEQQTELKNVTFPPPTFGAALPQQELIGDLSNTLWSGVASIAFDPEILSEWDKNFIDP